MATPFVLSKLRLTHKQLHDLGSVPMLGVCGADRHGCDLHCPVRVCYADRHACSGSD